MRVNSSISFTYLVTCYKCFSKKQQQCKFIEMHTCRHHQVMERTDRARFLPSTWVGTVLVVEIYFSMCCTVRLLTRLQEENYFLYCFISCKLIPQINATRTDIKHENSCLWVKVSTITDIKWHSIHSVFHNKNGFIWMWQGMITAIESPMLNNSKPFYDRRFMVAFHYFASSKISYFLSSKIKHFGISRFLIQSFLIS